jgi:transcription elongation factor Elf1
MSESKILKCPICNHTASVLYDWKCFSGQHYTDEPSIEGFRVRCDYCGLRTTWYHREKEALIAWNKRYEDE